MFQFDFDFFLIVNKKQTKIMCQKYPKKIIDNDNLCAAKPVLGLRILSPGNECYKSNTTIS
jgi:hypothetical protein